MKSPKTKFVVISAIGLASIVGIFVSAQSPSPSSTSGQELPFHLVLDCATVDATKLKEALKPLPSPTYRFQIGAETLGTLPADNSLTPCPAHFSGSSTQKAKFANTTALHDFLTAAGL